MYNNWNTKTLFNKYIYDEPNIFWRNVLKCIVAIQMIGHFRCYLKGIFSSNAFYKRAKYSLHILLRSITLHRIHQMKRNNSSWIDKQKENTVQRQIQFRFNIVFDISMSFSFFFFISMIDQVFCALVRFLHKIARSRTRR